VNCQLTRDDISTLYEYLLNVTVQVNPPGNTHRVDDVILSQKFLRLDNFTRHVKMMMMMMTTTRTTTVVIVVVVVVVVVVVMQ